MQPGEEKSTGHYVELRPKEGKKEYEEKWDQDAREFVKIERVYFYCMRCKQYAWGWESLCPERPRYNVTIKLSRVREESK